MISAVVLGAHPFETAERTVQCLDWERGPGASLRCGLAALPADAEAALVVLADGPELDPRAVDRVAASWRADGGDVVAASYGGVRLHPVLLARSTPKRGPSAVAAVSTLPAPWAIKVVVLNGSGDIVFTRSVASRIQALSYRVTHVGRATSFTYPQTQVYYPPGGEAIGVRLAKQLGVPVQPLPGGLDPRRLVVIVGPKRGPGD